MKICYLSLVCFSLSLKAQNVIDNQAAQLRPGTGNTLIGPTAGIQITTAINNSFLGINTGYNTTSGSFNSFVGATAGYANTTGYANVFAGQQAGYNNTAAAYNTFVGNSSGQSTTTGDGNTAIGDGALFSNVMGTNNTAIGRYAGLNIIAGSNNTFVGMTATAPPGSGPINNATAIGYNAQVTASNSVILGSGANVGIGNTAPSAKLHITTGQTNTSGLRLENLTSASPAAGGQSKFLTVDGAGNVILGMSGSGRSIATAELWSTTGDYLHNTNAGAVVIGQGVSNTPARYKLFVVHAILTEKVKVAVKNTSEWSDHVFDSSYSLQDLSEVDSYIKAHKHLPGVPSALEIVEKGVDVAKMDAKLLEKIEELTLYSIQLEKKDREKDQKLQQQQAQIDELKRLMKQMLAKTK